MGIRLNGSTSGYTELNAPAVAGNNSIALPTGNGTAYQVLRNGATAGSLEYADKIVSGTAQNSTSGTSIDFTGIPSWVKRVTVMFNGVSTNGTNNYLVQIGAGSFLTSGYNSYGVNTGSSALNGTGGSSGFIIKVASSSQTLSGSMVLALQGGNYWVQQHTFADVGSANGYFGGGGISLSGALDRVRITSFGGTDTFDAGSINILYE